MPKTAGRDLENLVRQSELHHGNDELQHAQAMEQDKLQVDDSEAQGKEVLEVQEEQEEANLI